MGGTPSLGWGYPSQIWMVGGTPARSGGGGYPSHVWMVGGGVPWPGLDAGGGVPSPGLDGGYPWYPRPIRKSSIASTCYAAGGIPLAFTQEDFLVFKISSDGRFTNLIF